MEIKTAHRLRDGYSFNPENSIAAALDAINNPNIGALETDIQLTKDGVFVLMNYKTLENVTSLFDPTRNKISDYTYEELCNMSFHASIAEIEKAITTNAGEFSDNAREYLEYYEELKRNPRMAKIATLEELLLLPRGEKHLFIEIKTDYSKEQKHKSIEYAKRLISLLKKCGTTNLSIIGRDMNTLEMIKQEDSSLLCLPVVGYNDTEKLTYGFDGASIALNHLEKEVPYTGKKAFEYLAEDDKPIAVWNLRTKSAYLYSGDIIKKAKFSSYYPTGDFIDRISKK